MAKIKLKKVVTPNTSKYAVKPHHSTAGGNDMNLSKLQEIMKDREAWHSAVHRVAESDMAE